MIDLKYKAEVDLLLQKKQYLRSKTELPLTCFSGACQGITSRSMEVAEFERLEHDNPRKYKEMVSVSDNLLFG